jgi:malate synthase
MSDVTIHGNLTIATVLYDLVNDEILAGTNITPTDFWNGFDQAAHHLAPKIRHFWKQEQRCKTRLMTG